MRLPMSMTDYPESDHLPAAEYPVIITEFSEVRTSEKAGKDFISMTLEVCGGDCVGRKLTEGYITVDEGSLMRRIAMAANPKGYAKIKDTDELIGCKLQVLVAVKESTEYGMQNRIKKYMPASKV